MKLPRLLTLTLLITALSSALAQTNGAAAKPAKKPAPATATTADQTGKKTPAEAKTKGQWYPFHGVVSMVNSTASTVSLHKEEGERVLRLDGKSTLSRLGKPATLSDLKTGDYAHGKLHKNERNEEVITDAKFDLEQPKKTANKSKITADPADKKPKLTGDPIDKKTGKIAK